MGGFKNKHPCVLKTNVHHHSNSCIAGSENVDVLLVPAQPGCPGQTAVKLVVVVAYTLDGT